MVELSKNRDATLSWANDEEYLIRRSKCADPNVAESWLLTAKTLFPTSFAIQFAIYSMYKDTKRFTDAANQLTELVANSRNEVGLINELKLIAGAIMKSGDSENSTSYAEIFDAMSPASQSELLLFVCHQANDTEGECQFMLLLIRRFPDCIAEHGPPLINSLLAKQEGSPDLQSRKLLVCEVLPLILPKVELNKKLLLELLEQSLIHYVHCLSDSLLDRSASEAKDLWSNLFDLLHQTALKLNWKLAELLQGPIVSENQLQRLKVNENGDIADLSKTGAKSSKEDRKQYFYVSFALFLRSVYFYGMFTMPSNSCGCVLVDFRETQPQPPKKKKLEKPPPQLSASANLPGDVAISLVGNFQTAVKCWKTLSSFKEDFERLSEVVGLDQWSFVEVFEVDAMVFENRHDEAIKSRLELDLKDPSRELKNHLQIASCHFAGGDKAKALTELIEAIEHLPEETRDRCVANKLTHVEHSQTQQLHFLRCVRDEVLRFCVQLITSCLKERLTDKRDDLSLGNLIVLSQLDWPANEELFQQLVEKIRKARAFTYPAFMNYIVVPDILEDFAFLVTQPQLEQESNRLQLEILPQGGTTSKRTVTRGVNKGAKEEIKLAMEKQMAKAHEDYAQVMIRFLREEKKSIIGGSAKSSGRAAQAAS